MAGTWRLGLGLVAAFFFGTAPLHAFPGCVWPSPPGAFYYYYAAPWPACYSCPIGPTVIPVPDAPRQPSMANPLPAPPETKKAAKISTDPRAPVITATHTQGGGPTLSSESSLSERCRVGFWNLTGREVTLVVEGKTWTLGKNRSVTLELQRQFAWQIDQQPQHVERVAEGKATYEVVIR